MGQDIYLKMFLICTLTMILKIKCGVSSVDMSVNKNVLSASLNK